MHSFIENDKIYCQPVIYKSNLHVIKYLSNSVFLNIMQVKSKETEIEVIRKSNEEERIKLLDEVATLSIHVHVCVL